MKHCILGLLLLSNLIIFFPSCDELLDPCENTVCYNGGFCDDGDCVCLNGYSGSNCQIPPVDPCVVNNTGAFCMENNSVTNKTYDIVLDGIKIMVLTPGQRKCATVTAGTHSLRMNFTNTSTRACSDANPSVPQCNTTSLVCSV